MSTEKSIGYQLAKIEDQRDHSIKQCHKSSKAQRKNTKNLKNFFAILCVFDSLWLKYISTINLFS